MSHVPDAIPTGEKKSRHGNKSPYQVLGKKYYVLDSAKGYRQRGDASWYGKKFHGHKTSNGETYDMYAMTAAHKSLPLPSFVKVTNLENGKQVVVRVNDRGPFHPGRIIDVSYAAAYRLGMLGKGTAHVEVEAIFDTPSRQTYTADLNRVPVREGKGQFLQVGAYSTKSAAQNVASRVQNIVREPVLVREVNISGRRIFRVQVGPLYSTEQSDGLIRELGRAGFKSPRLLDFSKSGQ